MSNRISHGLSAGVIFDDLFSVILSITTFFKCDILSRFAALECTSVVDIDDSLSNH